MMSRKDRAKQFLPFDAMKGLHEAMRDKELALFGEAHTQVDEEDEWWKEYFPPDPEDAYTSDD